MIKLHLGCGWRDFGDEYIHIDGGDYPHLDHKDITQLPFKDNSVDYIYSSHTLEYFDLERAKIVLEEWKRVLKPGAIMRIAVPDFQVMAELYVQKKFSLASFIGPMYGKMQMGHETIYHKVVYDFNLLSEVLSEVGFQSIRRYHWWETEHCMIDDHSQAYLPKMDKMNGTLISLNVQCVK